MGSDAFFGDLVHLFGADLDFKRRAFFSDHRCVQRLVQVGPRHGDEIFDSPGHRPPCIVHDAQNCITILDRPCDDPHGEHVVHLIHLDVLFLQFAVDAEQTLDTAFYFGGDTGFFQFVA